MVEEAKGIAGKPDSPVLQEGQEDQGGHVLLEGLEAPEGEKSLLGLRSLSCPLGQWHPIA